MAGYRANADEVSAALNDENGPRTWLQFCLSVVLRDRGEQNLGVEGRDECFDRVSERCETDRTQVVGCITKVAGGAE